MPITFVILYIGKLHPLIIGLSLDLLDEVCCILVWVPTMLSYHITAKDVKKLLYLPFDGWQVDIFTPCSDSTEVIA